MTEIETKNWYYKIEGWFESNTTAEDIAKAIVRMCKNNGLGIPEIDLECDDRKVIFKFKDNYEVK